MKLKLFSSFLLVLLLLFSTSCDDDLKYVGSDIQPGGDDVSLEVDTFLIKAKTISLNDSIYAWTLTGLLGKFDDSYLGSVKADYLSEFYCPDSAAFIKGYGDLTIDSVRLHVNFVRYTGDSLAPMGLSVYRVTSPLKNTFYTNINPADYCDMSDVLGQATYSINQAKRYKISSSLTVRSLIINLDNRVGEEFYDESKKENNAFQSLSAFKKFFPGVYVTTTFGANSLIVTESTALNIYYKYTDPTGSHDGRDTIKTSSFGLSYTPEVIQLNHIKNTIPSYLLDENQKTAYIKSPAGLAMQMELPIKEIVNKIGAGNSKAVNSAKLVLTGYTQEEDKYKENWARPSSLLLIDKDSVNNFFRKKQLPDSRTSILLTRNADNNTYYTYGSKSYNIAYMVSEYMKRWTPEKTDNPKFLILPVEIKEEYINNQLTLVGVFNNMKPTNAIIRNDSEHMKMSFMFSKY